MIFREALKKRRTVYGISKEVVVPEAKIEHCLQEALRHVPSAFNVPCSRAALLFHGAHERLWDTVREALRAIVPPDRFPATGQKIDGFKAGYGTALFFEDAASVKTLEEQYPAYAENVPAWVAHSSGMLQFAVWTLLEIEGLGASLQHYGIFMEEHLRGAHGVPENWRLIAQMPFGKPVVPPAEKTFNYSPDFLKVLK